MHFSASNILCFMIKFTYDIPENYKHGKLPVLDLEINVNKLERNRIDFEFFEKPTRNKRVMLEDAAIPPNQKRTILTQECLRRLRNTKYELGEEVRTKHLNNFMLKLKNSGYGTKYRTEILDSALIAYEKIISEDRAGIKPLYRSRDFNKEERDKNKISRKLNWYKNSSNDIEYKTVLFVPVTKGGKLAKELKKREQEINKNSHERIKIVEGGGIQMKNILVKKNPFPDEICEKKKCVLCNTDSNKFRIPCSTNNVGYRLICETCEDKGLLKVYEGETARSARTRGAEHLSQFKNERGDSALHKHRVSDHEGEDMKFRMEITNKFRDPLTRQANEAVRISKRKKHELLNSKTEFNHPPIARISVVRKEKQKFQKQNKRPAQPSLLEQ